MEVSQGRSRPKEKCEEFIRRDDGQYSFLIGHGRVQNAIDIRRESYLGAIFKKKRDIKACGKYKSTKLVSHTMNDLDEING